MGLRSQMYRRSGLMYYENTEYTGAQKNRIEKASKKKKSSSQCSTGMKEVTPVVPHVGVKVIHVDVRPRVLHVVPAMDMLAKL